MALHTQSGEVSDDFYSAFRGNGAPTYYQPNVTPVTADVLETGIIFACCILALAFVCILPGYKGLSRINTFVWIVTAIYVGGVILVSQFSKDWETSEIETNTKYKAGTGAEIQAKIGLNIGLKGVNITLKGEPVHQLNETINYNEHFSFSNRQGRLGFGPFANNFNCEYRAAQFRGLPLPILWVAEYFTLDGENLRWGRLYRESGFYASICLWISFGLWILTNILLFILLRYAAYTCMLTGMTMCTAIIIKHFLRAPLDLVVPFSSDHKLVMHYDVSFWLVLATGCLCLMCGLLVFILDLRLPQHIAIFFGVDILQDEKFSHQREASIVSQSTCTESLPSTTSDSGELEVVVVDGASSVKTSSQTQVRETKGKTGAAVLEADWVDCSSDSDVPNTDDEFNSDNEDASSRRSSLQSAHAGRGIFSRYQRPRRIPSARPNRYLTAKKPDIQSSHEKGGTPAARRRSHLFTKVNRITPSPTSSDKSSSHKNPWK